MNVIQISLSLSLILLHSISCHIISEESITEDGKAVADVTKKFSSKLYHATKYALLAESQENFVISPFSIGSVLSMLREGANGLTREELNELMEYESLNDNTISNGYHEILLALQGKTEPLVKIANRIYVPNSGEINADFAEILESKYQTKIQPSDFRKSQMVANDMNLWVEDVTEGKITNLISEDSIDENTKAIVANAIYFKGKWATAFNEKVTHEQDFQGDDGNVTRALFMEQDDVFLHADLPELNATAVAMSYEGERFHLITILPDDGVRLSETEEQLKQTSFEEILLRMTKKSLRLTYPKFKLETELDFSGVLRKLGLKASVNPGRADFSLISADQKIHLDKVLQKCFIDITEHGTEAAGATYVKIVPFSFRRNISFKVTKPFLAYIFDSYTKTVLFIVRKTKM